MLDGFVFGFGVGLGAAAAVLVLMTAGFLLGLAWSLATARWERDDPNYLENQRRGM